MRCGSSRSRQPAGSSRICTCARDLWAKVTRALFYDLVELGEERDVGGQRMFGIASERRVLRHAAGRELEGFAVSDGLLASDGHAIGRDFFARARARLTLDVPPALTDQTRRRRARRSRSRSLPVGARRRRGDASGRRAGGRGRPSRSRPCCSRCATPRLEAHAGQIAFPGGKIEPERSPRRPPPRCARPRRRSASRRGLVDPIGYLDLYLTFSGFRILPTVARVDPGYRLTLNRAEVDDAFEVPLAFLMDAQNHALHSRDWKGVIRRYYAMPFGERYIWGVTAGILRNLYERIYLG